VKRLIVLRLDRPDFLEYTAQALGDDTGAKAAAEEVVRLRGKLARAWTG
jgi:hypothetical protein